MTAPTSPPATSVALTAAQAATELNPDTASAKAIYIYAEAAASQAPGYTVASLVALMNIAPKTAVPKTAAAFVAALAANDSKKIYAFVEATVDAGAFNFDVADLVPLLNAAFPQYATTAVRSVRANGENCIIWTTPGTVPNPQTFFDDSVLLILEKASHQLAGGLFYKILGGSYDGKYIRHEDVVAVVR